MAHLFACFASRTALRRFLARWRIAATIALIAALGALGGGGPAAAAVKHAVHRYSSEATAQKHCPKDAVVYGRRKDGAYYYPKGDDRYGHIHDAVYVCQKEADRGGWHSAEPH